MIYSHMAPVAVLFTLVFLQTTGNSAPILGQSSATPNSGKRSPAQGGRLHEGDTSHKTRPHDDEGLSGRQGPGSVVPGSMFNVRRRGQSNATFKGSDKGFQNRTKQIHVQGTKQIHVQGSMWHEGCVGPQSSRPFGTDPGNRNRQEGLGTKLALVHGKRQERRVKDLTKIVVDVPPMRVNR